MERMSERERFLRYMHFQPVDRIPLMEMGLWPETLERWHREGLPKWVTSLRHLEDYLRLDRSFNLQPRLVRRIITDRLKFGKDLLRRVLSTGYLDFVQIWEDMAYKTASLISPQRSRPAAPQTPEVCFNGRIGQACHCQWTGRS